MNQSNTKGNNLNIIQRIGLTMLGFKAAAQSGSVPFQGPELPLIPTSQNKKPIWTDMNYENAVKQGYKTCAWVFACATRKARAASSIPWKVKERTKNGGLKELPEHPLELLMSKPNPFIDGSDMIERQIYNLELGGNGILQKVRARGVPVELWPLGPAGVTPVPSQQDFISKYEYKIGSDKRDVDPNDIIHAKYIDPNNLYWGMAPILAAAYAIDTDIEAAKWNKVSLQNRAVTDGVFAFKEPMTTEQWEDARARIREQHQGSAVARTPWVISGGATWTQMGMTPVEMDFIESRKFNLTEICAVEGVPQIIVIYDDPSLNNIREAKKVFWEDTLIPLLDDLKSVYNNSLAVEFGDKIVLDYDISGVEALRDTFDKKVETAKSLWSMGVPFNVVNSRLELGFEDIEGGDVGYLPVGVLPVDDIGVDVTLDDEDPDDNAEPEPGDEGDDTEPKKKV